MDEGGIGIRSLIEFNMGLLGREVVEGSSGKEVWTSRERKTNEKYLRG